MEEHMKKLTAEETNGIWNQWLTHYPEPRRFFMPELTEEQKESCRKASELLSKYASQHKMEIVWEKHNPIVSDEMRKKLGLDREAEK